MSINATSAPVCTPPPVAIAVAGVPQLAIPAVNSKYRLTYHGDPCAYVGVATTNTPAPSSVLQTASRDAIAGYACTTSTACSTPSSNAPSPTKPASPSAALRLS